MLWITTPCGKYGVTWRHYQTERRTVCKVIDATEQQVTTGRAWCSDEDQFCKEIGRKISLGRALQNVVSYSVRAAIWAGYFARKGASVVVDRNQAAIDKATILGAIE